MTRILLVDDEPHFLEGLVRSLRKEFDTITAVGASQALDILAQDHDIGVIVADMGMPGMNGADLLACLARRFPGISRLMLTGNADQQTAIDALNTGRAFRFLRKPCERDELVLAIREALQFYDESRARIEAEDKARKGGEAFILELIGTLSPLALSRARDLGRLAGEAGRALGADDPDVIACAALCSAVGWIGVPQSVRRRSRAGLTLSHAERNLLNRHVDIAYGLLASLPHFGEIAEIVLLQDKGFNGAGYPETAHRGEGIPLGARILKVLNAVAPLENNRPPDPALCRELSMTSGDYDPAVIAVICDLLDRDSTENETGHPSNILEIPLPDLRAGDRLEEPLFDNDGSISLCSGHILDQDQIEQLNSHSRFFCLPGLVTVSRPARH